MWRFNRSFVLVLILSCFLSAANLSFKIYDTFNPKIPSPIINILPKDIVVDSSQIFELAQWEVDDGWVTADEFAKDNETTKEEVVKQIIMGRLEAKAFKLQGTGWMIPRGIKMPDPNIPLPKGKIVLPKNP